ncbi:molybdopterin-guanine dinucleotide biosynthesis protein B [Chloroflexota bacterium]
MPPLVSIVGKSETGKTTLIEKLIRELRTRGYRVATIKHVPENLSFDEPEKDSWRHIQAGSQATAISSTERLVIIKPVSPALDIEQIAHHIGEEYDIVLAEGFKESNAPKIEVHRKAVGPPLSAVKKLVAIVTDEPLTTKTRQFSPEDAKGIIDLIEQGFIKPQGKRILLYVNNYPVPLTLFPKKFITSTILSMISALKGTGKVKSAEIYLRQEPD